MPVGTTGTLLADRYRVIERIGSGGMASVLLAEDERLGRQVAIKRLHAESPEDTARRFRREARLGASLNHPNLVSVYDIVSDDEGVLIVMEYVDGETLRDALGRGPLPAARAVEVLRGLAAGLDHAHAEGIVHRDVKPANVLLGRRPSDVKLADLGIATAVESTRITKSGTVMGTASYMAPEQLEGHRAGPEADVYSLAVVAWEALSGKRAYEGRTPIEIATRKASEPPPALTEAWPDAPPGAVAVLQRAMGADPASRPRSATALVDELERALRPRQPAPVARVAPVAPVVHTQPRQPRTRWLPALALLVALVVAGAAILAFAGSDSSSPPSKQSAAKAHKKTKKHHASTAAAPAPQPAATPTQPSPAPSTSAPGTSGKALNDQGYSLIQQGRYREAVPILERAVHAFAPGTTDINYQYALFNLGHALRLAGRPAEAIPILEQRLRFPDQRAKVQAELDAARSAAGGQTAPQPQEQGKAKGHFKHHGKGHD
jgi:serine/threonine-protein kinase